MFAASNKDDLTKALLSDSANEAAPAPAQAAAPTPVNNLAAHVPEVKPKSIFSYAYPVVKAMSHMTDASEGMIAGVESQMVLMYMLGFAASPILIEPTLSFLIPFNIIWIVLTLIYLKESYQSSIKLADIQPERKLTAELETISTTVQPEETPAETYKTVEDFYKSKNFAAITSLSRTRVDFSLDKYTKGSFFMRCAMWIANALGWFEAAARGVFTIAGIDAYVINRAAIQVHTLRNQAYAVAGGGLFKLVKHGAEKAVAKATPSIAIMDKPDEDLKIPKWENHEKARLALTFILAVTRHSCPCVWWSRLMLEIVNNITGTDPVHDYQKFYTLLASGLVTSLLFSFPVVVQGMVTRTKYRATLEEIKMLEGKYPEPRSDNMLGFMDFGRALTYWKLVKEVIFMVLLAVKGMYDFTDNLNQNKDIENLPLSRITLWILMAVFLIANFMEFALLRKMAFEQEHLDKRITFHYWQEAIKPKTLAATAVAAAEESKDDEADAALGPVTTTATAARDVMTGAHANDGGVTLAEVAV